MSLPSTREELVGKRFLCVCSGTKLKISKVAEWPWKSGLIRCASHLDPKDPDLQILVEFDHLDWEKREWLSVHKDNYHLLLVEESLCLATRQNPTFSTSVGSLHPALTFKPLVDNVGLWRAKNSKPVEFLVDLKLDFQDYNKLKHIRYWDSAIPGLNLSVSSERCVREWSEVQDGQHILITTPSVLLGFRLKVYRAEGTTQWYTAVTTGYNESNNEFTLTDDTVLEEHFEDPRLTQMKLLGEGVVESILKGENVGITPRRSRSGQVANSVSSANNSGNGQQAGIQNNPAINRNNLSATANSRLPPPATIPKKSSLSSTPSPSESSSNNSNSSSNKKAAPASQASSRPVRAASAVASAVIESTVASPPSPPVVVATVKRGRGRPPLLQSRKVVAVLAKPKTSAGAIKQTTESKHPRGRKKKVVTSSIEERKSSRASSQRDSTTHGSTASSTSSSSISGASSSGSASSSEETTNTRPLILSSRKETSGKGPANKRKAIAIVRPQQHVREEENEETEEKFSDQNPDQQDNPDGESSRKSDIKPDKHELPGSTDREARFSLYDFPSDSETEEKLSSSNLTGNNPASVPGSVCKKNTQISDNSGNRNNNRKPFSFSSPKRPVDSDVKKPTNRTSPNKTTTTSSAPSATNSNLSDSNLVGNNSQTSSSTTAAATTTTLPPPSSSATSVKQETAPTITSSASTKTVSSSLTSDKEFQQPPAPGTIFHPPTLIQNNDLQPPPSSRASEMQHLQSHPMSSHHHHQQQQQQQQQHHSDENGVTAVTSRDHRGDDNRSTDSGVSTIRSVSGDERSGSRSSTVSDERSLRPSPYLPETSSTSPPTSNSHPSQHQAGRSSGGPPVSSAGQSSSVWRDPTLLALHQARTAVAAAAANAKLPPHLGHGAMHPSAAAMAEHHRQASAAGSAPSNSTNAISAAAATAAQFSAIQHYQAALQAASLGVSPHHTASLLAQYQNLANLPPDVLMKQFPSLAGLPQHLMTAGRAGPGGLPPGHAELLMARDREIERERALRERREAEQRERDRLEKERVAEKERREREQRERERREAERRERERQEQRQKLSAVEAVDNHFKMSMELAQKRAAQQWPPLPGIRPMGSSGSGGSSHEEERRRYESSEASRRAHEEAAAARHFLNMAAAARSNVAAASLIHRPPQQQQPSNGGHNNNKPGQQQQSPYSTSAASIHYPQGHRGPVSGPQKGDPGPPPPLLRTNGASMSAHHNIPTSSAAAAMSAKQHQQQLQQHADPKYPVGFKPYEMYPSRSSSTSPSPGSHHPLQQHHARHQQPQGNRPSPTGHERHAHSPRYSSSLPPPSPSSQRPPLGGSPVPSQVYGKPISLAMGSASMPPLQAPPQMSHIAQTPPPAHGGSAPRHVAVSHLGNSVEALTKNNIQQHHPHQHIPAARPMVQPEVAQPPTTIQHAHQQPHTDLPLDLGLPTKRRADIYDEYHSIEVGSVSPKKLFKIEPNAQLFKVSEPSVLQASEPSIITTVVNSALTSVGSSINNDPLPQAETQSETSTTREEGEEGTASELPFGYVHKLKKAWIKSYSSDPKDPASGGSSNPATPPSSQQAQSASVRATPSPALSNKSTGSATSSSRGTGRGAGSGGSGMVAAAAARIAGSKPVNGHSSATSKKKHLTSSSESEEEDDEDESLTFRTSTANSRGGAGGKKLTSTRGGRGARHLRQRTSKVGRAAMSATASSGESLLGGDSDKDSDISTATSRKSQRDVNTAAPTGKKRGRKPGRGGAVSSGKNSSVTNSPSRNSSKKMKEDNASLSSSSASSETPKRLTGNKKKKPSVAQLKKTGQSFLQDASCFEVAPKLAKCRECRWTQSQRNKKMPNIFCRFYAFRRVRYAKNGQLCVAGFCDPKKDVAQEDKALWLASSEAAPNNLDDEQSIFLLDNLRVDFDQMLKQERLAVEAHEGEENVVAWKRVVQGVREMCDVCDANLFNFHWACGKCGFVVCLDCYVDRKHDVVRVWGEESGGSSTDRDKYSWLLCTNRTQHEIGRLMLTQIIAGDALEQVANKMRDECRTTFKTSLSNGNVATIKKEDESTSGTHLRDLIGTEHTVKMSDIIDQAVENSMEDQKKSPFKVPLRHFVRRVSDATGGKGKIKTEAEEENYAWRHGLAPAVRSYNIGETKPLYQGVPHSWLCDGKVLRFEVPQDDEKKAIDLFQEVWRRGQPIVVGNATQKMNLTIWEPSRLSTEFGAVAVELTNIQTGDVLAGNHTLKKFWDGFSNVSKRLRDEDGEPALLKLKDWPSPGNSGEEFSESLPQHAANILAGLPLPAYTDRGVAGMFNLAANLPDVFVRPDLGPRSYISYGDSQSPDCGTYNLHLELADTLWVLVRAETPSDLDKPEYKNQVMRTLEFVGCSSEVDQIRAADGSEALPGCVWHIFHPSHADGIRDLLNREAAEKRAKAKRMLTKKSRATAANADDDTDDPDNEDRLDPNFDPIHEEGTYLNSDLLKKLADDYGIVPFVFTLFEGEAVVIPAGAPRQVKYLQSCISVCVDFVSPENLSHSCHLVRQFRFLSETQQPAPEDRFQVKNLVFHSVKKALSVREKNKNKRNGKIKAEEK